jgi:hypothetical protein
MKLIEADLDSNQCMHLMHGLLLDYPPCNVRH